MIDSGVRHVLVRQEQNAGHAASGYARLSGKPGVCIATSGPGATNLITALATAYMDSIPLIAITGRFLRADRQGCVSGSGYYRCGGAFYKIFLFGEKCTGYTYCI
jgi:thiamine pyrophosphate-dependent acetolactate synthase large subunit-like protein